MDHKDYGYASEKVAGEIVPFESGPESKKGFIFWGKPFLAGPSMLDNLNKRLEAIKEKDGKPLDTVTAPVKPQDGSICPKCKFTVGGSTINACFCNWD